MTCSYLVMELVTECKGAKFTKVHAPVHLINLEANNYSKIRSKPSHQYLVSFSWGLKLKILRFQNTWMMLRKYIMIVLRWLFHLLENKVSQVWIPYLIVFYYHVMWTPTYFYIVFETQNLRSLMSMQSCIWAWMWM